MDNKYFLLLIFAFVISCNSDDDSFEIDDNKLKSVLIKSNNDTLMLDNNDSILINEKSDCETIWGCTKANKNDSIPVNEKSDCETIWGCTKAN